MSDDNLIIDDYQLTNCISTGNTTQIWEVSEQGSNLSYAMKLLLPEALGDADETRVLKAEAKVGKLFNHPSLLKAHKVVVNKRFGYILMDLVRASNLKSQIYGDLPALQSRIRNLIESTALGLEHIHERGWVHRDIKPDNILLSKGGQLHIVDYSLTAKNKRKHKDIQGTKSYIAPETLLRKPVTPQTDMYSFGITLFLVLTGELPITGLSPKDILKNHLRTMPGPPSKINPNITPEMDEFVLRMLAKKPENRFASMTEIYSSFRNITVFKEDAQELHLKQQEEEKQQNLERADAAGLLDSRLDDERSKANPAQKTAPKKQSPAPQPTAKPAPPQQPVAQQPAPQQPIPTFAQQPYPQQPYPQQQFPQQPFPQQQFPQQPYPQYPQQQVPQQQPFPQQPYPQQQYPYPQQPAPQFGAQPMPSHPEMPQQPVQQPAAPIEQPQQEPQQEQQAVPVTPAPQPPVSPSGSIRRQPIPKQQPVPESPELEALEFMTEDELPEVL